MPLTGGATTTAAIGSLRMACDAKMTIDLPGMAGTSVTLPMKSVTFSEEDTSSFPDALSETAGELSCAGSAVFTKPRNAPVNLLQLLDPDDPSSPLYQQHDKVIESVVRLWLGVAPAGTAPELLLRLIAYVKSWTVDHYAGTVTVDFEDVPAGFDNLPDGLDAVLVPPPFNAGLTNEFVYDRIARACTGGRVSSWQMQRPGTLLAVGLRSSLAPEVGTLLSGGVPTFTAGTFGTALADVGNGLSWQLASNPDLSAVTLEFLRWAATAGTTVLTIANTTTQAVLVTRSGADLTVTLGTGAGPSHTFVGALNTSGAAQYVLITASLTTGAVSLTVDGTVRTATLTGTIPTGTPQPVPILGIFALAGAVEGLIISTEATPASNYAWTPTAILDPSLNALQAVPPIAPDSSGWDEENAAAESEAGWIGFRQGVLTFLNRETIRSQTSSRVIDGKSLKPEGFTKSVGGVTQYNDVSVDYTEWTIKDPATVFRPSAVWKVSAGTTRTFDRSIADGATASVTPGPISWLPQGTNPNDGNHWMRWSLDRFGNGEFPSDRITARVDVIDSSTVRITVHNRHRVDAFGCDPANYTDLSTAAVGDPTIWVGGRIGAPDNPTTTHQSYGSGDTTLPLTGNAYWQDRDSVDSFAADTLAQVRIAKPTYSDMPIVPDPRVLVADLVTALMLIDGGQQAVDVFVWGTRFTADFDKQSPRWEQSLSVRAAAPPGNWVLGVSALGVDNFLYPAT